MTEDIWLRFPVVIFYIRWRRFVACGGSLPHKEQSTHHVQEYEMHGSVP
jgi:hypothetical protein